MTKVTHEAAISQEISMLEQQMRYAIDLREKVATATEELTSSYFGLINAQDEFERIKKENIEEIRRYKFAISHEAKEIDADVKRMAAAVSKDRIEQLKEFADVCERLQQLRSSGFFETVRLWPNAGLGHE